MERRSRGFRQPKKYSGRCHLMITRGRAWPSKHLDMIGSRVPIKLSRILLSRPAEANRPHEWFATFCILMRSERCAS